MSGNALITGATGFVGRRLTEHLSRSGWNVTACGYPPEAGVLPCDVRAPEQLAEVLRQAGDVTHVFHLAAIAFVPQASADPALAFDVNLQGTVRLIHALLKHAPRARLLFVSTSEVYGPPQYLPVDEAHPLQPANPYAISKAAADHYCAYAAKAHALDVIRARPFNHSGPGQSDAFVLSSFARQVAAIESGKKPPVLEVGNLDASRDFLHVDDVIRAYEGLALQGASGAAYNIASGTPLPIRDALDTLLQLARCPIEVRTDPARMRPSEVPESYGSFDKLHRDTGWSPRNPTQAILTELLEYWRAVESAA